MCWMRNLKIQENRRIPLETMELRDRSRCHLRNSLSEPMWSKSKDNLTSPVPDLTMTWRTLSGNELVNGNGQGKIFWKSSDSSMFAFMRSWKKRRKPFIFNSNETVTSMRRCNEQRKRDFYVTVQILNSNVKLSAGEKGN
uniref:Uncharacterized protein n=1 Tax=Sphaerodactylus townsendi TaxID=933632 RepID=A0ACB8EFQ8_9SAUR